MFMYKDVVHDKNQYSLFLLLILLLLLLLNFEYGAYAATEVQILDLSQVERDTDQLDLG